MVLVAVKVWGTFMSLPDAYLSFLCMGIPTILDTFVHWTFDTWVSALRDVSSEDGEVRMLQVPPVPPEALRKQTKRKDVELFASLHLSPRRRSK